MPGNHGLPTRGDLCHLHVLDPHSLPSALAQPLQRQCPLLHGNA
jgi:hypothetical protein